MSGTGRGKLKLSSINWEIEKYFRSAWAGCQQEGLLEGLHHPPAPGPGWEMEVLWKAPLSDARCRVQSWLRHSAFVT